MSEYLVFQGYASFLEMYGLKLRLAETNTQDDPQIAPGYSLECNHYSELS
jgi:hypothetical protein